MANGIYKITDDFEQMLAHYTGAKYVITLDNMSNALFLTKSSEGSISSFNNQDFLNRFNPDIIPNNIKTLIKKDSELHYLMGALGYQYKIL